MKKKVSPTNVIQFPTPLPKLPDNPNYFDNTTRSRYGAS